jgi:PcfJ-like protein
MSGSRRGGDGWGRGLLAAPEWAETTELLVESCMAPPVTGGPLAAGPDFDALFAAARADLQRRLASPVRVAETGTVRVVCLIDALVFVHDTARRRVCTGAWQPDGTLAINTTRVVEIGRPLAGFTWLDAIFAQWHAMCPVMACGLCQPQLRNRLRNALVRWLRSNADLRNRRRAFREALHLDARVAWMAVRLDRPVRGVWLSAAHYNAVGRQLERLEWALADSPALFRLVGLALLDGRLANPDEPVESTLAQLRSQRVSLAAWRAACRLGPRLFDAALGAAVNTRLIEACVEVLRQIEHTDFLPMPAALQKVLYWQHAERDSNRVLFRQGWCTFEPWFLRHAARAARAAECAGRIDGFIDDDFLPAMEWLLAARPRPDANQMHAGWRWIQRARDGWANDPARRWEGSRQSWSSALKVLYCGGYNAFALTEANALVEEGRVMHHCIATYIEACLRDEVRVFSLRDVNTGQRVATAMLRNHHDGQWALVDVRLRMNRKAEGVLLNAALLLACRYGEAMARA